MKSALILFFLPIIASLKTLAQTLRDSTGASTTNYYNVQNNIQNAHHSFNVFSVVRDSSMAENLSGISATDGIYTFNGNSGFVYNSATNIISTGHDIENMSGGANDPNIGSNVDGKKWMAMAMYDDGTFKGILIWVFQNTLSNGTQKQINIRI